MSFIQGNINSKDDLIEAMDAMRGMLTQGGRKAELALELAEVSNKLDNLIGPTAPVMGEDEYAYLGILHALKNNLEERLRKLEDVDMEPQETGYDDNYDEEPTQSDAKQEYKKFLEVFLEKAYGVPKPQEVEEEGSVGFSAEYLGEILEKINAQTQAEIDLARKNPWGL